MFSPAVRRASRVCYSGGSCNSTSKKKKPSPLKSLYLLHGGFYVLTIRASMLSSPLRLLLYVFSYFFFFFFSRFFMLLISSFDFFFFPFGLGFLFLVFYSSFDWCDGIGISVRARAGWKGGGCGFLSKAMDWYGFLWF